MNDEESYKKLEKVAIKKGFKVLATPYINNSYNNQTQKTIHIYCQINKRENFILAHEVGHIYEHKISRYFTVYFEFYAWVVGYIVCKVNKINTKGYWKVAKECLKTYIKKC